MSSLNVPQQTQQTSGKTITPSRSAVSLRRSDIEHVDDLVPITRSRRNSESDVASLSGTSSQLNASVSAAQPDSASAQPTTPALAAQSSVAADTQASTSASTAQPTPAPAAAASPDSTAQPTQSTPSNTPAPVTTSQGAPDHATPSSTAVATTSPGAPGSAAHQAGLVPSPQGPSKDKAENAALTSPTDWKHPDHPDHLKVSDPASDRTTIYVGTDKKAFHIHTAELKQGSPYFKKLLAEDTGHNGKVLADEQTTFEDLDEPGMGLFMHWLQTGGKLNGPHDFHSLAHYLSLYVLALKFEIEGLQNQGKSPPPPHQNHITSMLTHAVIVMDLVRYYYSDQNMTAPAYRLEYIYTYTHQANAMRTFLVSTAAFRALEEAPRNEVTAENPMLTPGAYLSGSIKDVLAKNPEMAVDFIEEVIKIHRDGELDARHGPDCA